MGNWDNIGFYFEIFILFLVTWFFFCVWHAHVCLCVCICAHRCLQKPEEEGWYVPWSWNCRWLWAPWYGCWEANPSPLQELQTLLTAEPSRPSISFYFILLSVYSLMFFRFGEKRPEDRNPLWKEGYLLDHCWFSFWSLLRPHGRKLLVITYCYLPETVLFCRELHCVQVDLTEVTEIGEKTDTL